VSATGRPRQARRGPTRGGPPPGAPATVGLLVGLATLAVVATAAGVGSITIGGARDRGWELASSEAWPDDAVVYHVFVDRFADGDADDTQVAGSPDDPGYADALTDWMGGDLAGLRARLDHVVATGANTLWLSPVTAGPFFHGYHPTGLTEVDPRFGDVDQLGRLVDDAHARGLKVVYDLVLNHTSDQHPWFVAAQADCDAEEAAFYRFRECPDRYAAFAGLPELPQLDLDHPTLRAHVFDEVLPFWLDDIGVDGFRLDHVEGPSRDFWRAMRAEVDDRWPGTLLLGEVWSQQVTIDGYGDVLDAATAFPFRDRLEAVFARGGAMPALAGPVAGWLDDDGVVRDAIPLPATYLSSHDQPRFTTLAGGDTDRTALAYRTILTLPGLPVVYAGDEVGMAQTERLPAGAPFQDRWYREPFQWDDTGWDQELLDAVAAAARTRTTSTALHAGAFVDHLVDGPVWVYERAADAERVVVVVNNGDTSVTLDLGEVVGDPALGTVEVAPIDLEVVEATATG
jgi:cyclomaltodextrinase / maltogenic alpha-amylase / neopullulanase